MTAICTKILFEFPPAAAELSRRSLARAESPIPREASALARSSAARACNSAMFSELHRVEAAAAFAAAAAAAAATTVPTKPAEDIEVELVSSSQPKVHAPVEIPATIGAVGGNPLSALETCVAVQDSETSFDGTRRRFLAFED